MLELNFEFSKSAVEAILFLSKLISSLTRKS